MRRAWMWVVALSVLGGCGQSPSAFFATQKDSVGPKFVELEAVAAAAKREPPMTADAPAADAASFEVCAFEASDREPSPSCDTWVVYLDRIVDLGVAVSKPVDLGAGSGLFGLTANLLAKGHTQPTPAHPEGQEVVMIDDYLRGCFAQVARMKYLIVVRDRDVKLSTASADGKNFTPGVFRGDALVYTLASAKRVAAFVLDVADTPATAQTAVKNGVVDAEAIAGAVPTLVRRQLREKLQAALPGVKLPPI